MFQGVFLGSCLQSIYDALFNSSGDHFRLGGTKAVIISAGYVVDACVSDVLLRKVRDVRERFQDPPIVT